MSLTISTGPTFLPALDWARLNPHGHSVQFYEDDDFLLDGLSRFVGSALGAGDAAIVIATEAHRASLEHRLRSRGLDTGKPLKQGRFVPLDAAETLDQLMVNGLPDPGLFANVIGGMIEGATAACAGVHPRIAAFGEMVALLWEDGNAAAALELEKLWNDLGRHHEFYLHCAYPMRLFSATDDADPIGRVCAEHARVIPADDYTSLTTEDERHRAVIALQQKARALESEINARKQLEDALVAQNRELSQALNIRDEFMSVAAHELRTPVTSLRLIAQGLLRYADRQREITPDRLASALSTLELQTDKVNKLITRLLDRAQIEAGKLRLDRAPTDLVALIESALRPRQDGGVHAILFERPDALVANVDAVRFEQVVTNLVDNALKFSPQGGTVAVELGTQPDGSIRLAVTDQGIGVPPERRETIFERFGQAHSDRHLAGMGLGLYVTREIVTLHGGTIEVEEPEHPGSRFVVRLPASAVGPADFGVSA
jgi:signal transduction histidine kinase